MNWRAWILKRIFPYYEEPDVAPRVFAFEGAPARIYMGDAVVEAAEGWLARKFLGARITFKLIIQGADSDFVGPIGKKFQIGGALVDVRGVNGGSLIACVPARFMTFGPEELVFDAVYFNGAWVYQRTFEGPDGTVTLKIEVGGGWMEIPNIVAEGRARGMAAALVKHARIIGVARQIQARTATVVL